MPDMERITDQLKVDMANAGYKLKGKGADYWDGFRDGKSHARWQVAILFAIAFFSISAIGHYFGLHQK